MRDQDRKTFTQALEKMLYACNGDRVVPKHHQDTYWNTLKRFGLADVLRAMQKAINESSSHITPGELRALVQPTVPFEDSTNPAARAPEQPEYALKRVEDMSDWERVQGDANRAYAKRLTGGRMMAAVDAGPLYVGSFQVQPSVDAAPIPEHRPRREGETVKQWQEWLLREHRRCWAEMRKILAHEWRQSQGLSGPVSAV